MPASRRAAVWLLYLNAGLWMILGIVSAGRLAGRPGQDVAAVIVAGLMAGNAGALAVCGYALGRGWRWGWWLAVAVLGANAVLAIADQLGLLDIAFFLFNLGILGLLLAARAQFLRR